MSNILILGQKLKAQFPNIEVTYNGCIYICRDNVANFYEPRIIATMENLTEAIKTFNNVRIVSLSIGEEYKINLSLDYGFELVLKIGKAVHSTEDLIELISFEMKKDKLFRRLIEEFPNYNFIVNTFCVDQYEDEWSTTYGFSKGRRWIDASDKMVFNFYFTKIFVTDLCEQNVVFYCSDDYSNLRLELPIDKVIDENFSIRHALGSAGLLPIGEE